MIERMVTVILLALTSIIMLALSITAWRRRGLGLPAIFLSICMAGVAVYSFGYVMELVSNTLRSMMFWIRFQHWGIQVIAPTWLLFTLAVSGHEKRISTKLILALSIIPAYLFLSAQTLGWLNLAHHNPRIDSSGSYPFFIYDRNLFNYIAVSFYVFSLLFSIYLFLAMLIRSAPSFRKQAAIFLIGSLVPLFPLVEHNLALSRMHLDFTPVALGVSGLFFAYGILKFRVLDILPLARDAIFEHMYVGALILDREDRVIDFNPSLQKILPEINPTTIGMSVKVVFLRHPALLALVESNQSGGIEFELVDHRQLAHYRVDLSLMSDRKNRLVGKIVSFSDFTNEKRLMNELEKQAALDGLTGVYNRQHFDKIVAREISHISRYGGALSLLMLDLDHFKEINDVYGHEAGDHVLIAIAGIFLSNLRQSDTLARFGGDEFLILLPETDLESARMLAERLCLKLSQQRIAFEGQRLDVSGSFGVASIEPGTEMSLVSLYRFVDRAMYRAKNAGGNQVSVYLPELIK